MPSPTERFSDRVGDYARYRPSYPEGLFAALGDPPLGWGAQTVVADVGAGTGLFTRPLARRVGRVWALEPNEAMRAQGQAQTEAGTSVVWTPHTGEATGLADASLDGLTCAQAFHWLDRDRAAVEWRRVLRPGAAAVVVWNDRAASAFADDYEALLTRWCPEYPQVHHKAITPEVLAAFFAGGRLERREWPNAQRFDLEGWQGRLRSSSYTPKPGTPEHEGLMADLEALYRRSCDGEGLVTFPYSTVVWIGRF